MKPPRKIDPLLRDSTRVSPPGMASWSDETLAQIDAQYQAWERICFKVVKNANSLESHKPAPYTREEVEQLGIMLKNMEQLSAWIGGERGQKIAMLHDVAKLAYDKCCGYAVETPASQN